MKGVTKFGIVLFKERLVSEIEICFYRGMLISPKLMNVPTLNHRAELS